MKKLVTALFIAMTAAFTFAGQFDDGIAAYKRGDYPTAARLMKIGAQQGGVGAQYYLGQMYIIGQGVPQDYTEAAGWFRLAAQKGHAGAQYNLGFLYKNGQGVPQHYAEAIRWYKLAAQQGDAQSQRNLGDMYANGQGVPQDYVRAHLWFNLAATKGNPVYVAERDNITKRMTPKQIAEAQKMASECLASNYKKCD